MKQIAIVMSLVLSVFVLSGCNGTGDDNNADKKACDKKGADWVWNVTKKECVAKATTKEECDEKGAGWVWDETNKKCNQVTAGLSDKEKCETKGAGWYWNEDKATDAGEEYKKCTKDLSMDCTDPAKPLVKSASPLECVASYYTIINSTGRIISYESNSIDDDINEDTCVSVYKEKFDEFNSFLRIETTPRGTSEFLGQRRVIICQTGGEGFGGSCPSEAGIYEISAGRTGFVVTKADKTVEELREMGCFSYIIEAEGPL